MNIRLTDLLPVEHITVPLEAVTFFEAVREMLQQLREEGVIHEVEPVERALSAARGRDLVSIGGRVALPHFRTEEVEQLVLALGVSRTPLEARDTALTEDPMIVALVLAPPEAATRYLQTVAALARLFRDESVVDRMAAAGSSAEVLAMTELGDARIQPDLRVRDVMVHRTAGVSPDMTVRAALELMLKQGWRAVPVLGKKGEVLGILTEWDVMRAMLPEIPRAGQLEPVPEHEAELVKDAMTRSVLCVSEEMDIEEAAHMMTNKNIEHFPVVNESALTGILTRGDILRKLFGR